MHGEMACRVCGWWPPVVRVRKGTTEPATDGWRWRKLREHIQDAADAEMEDGRDDGPHGELADVIDWLLEPANA